MYGEMMNPPLIEGERVVCPDCYATTKYEGKPPCLTCGGSGVIRKLPKV